MRERTEVPFCFGLLPDDKTEGKVYIVRGLLSLKVDCLFKQPLTRLCGGMCVLKSENVLR